MSAWLGAVLLALIWFSGVGLGFTVGWIGRGRPSQPKATSQVVKAEACRATTLPCCFGCADGVCMLVDVKGAKDATL